MNMVQAFPDVDFEREVEKRIAKRLNKLDQGQREAFELITKRVLSHLDFASMREDIQHKYHQDLMRGKNPNVFFYFEGVNKALNKIENRVVRRKSSRWTEQEVAEFSYQVSYSLRSVCRRFDPMARCWTNMKELLIAANAGRLVNV